MGVFDLVIGQTQSRSDPVSRIHIFQRGFEIFHHTSQQAKSRRVRGGIFRIEVETVQGDLESERARQTTNASAMKAGRRTILGPLPLVETTGSNNDITL